MTAKQEHAVQLQVKLEFGHNASCRKKPTPEGFTHDWTVFVRGPDNKDISHFVDKVVFHLHESFPKPKRVFKDPPYRIEEHGYGSFNLPIDVYFKNKEEPKKVKIDYDLFLPAMGLPAIDNIRSEALKFINPPEEFKRKVLKSGGVIVDSTNCINGSPVMSTNTNINGNTNGNHHLHNGKEMRKEIKEEKPTTASETEKIKKPKPDKLISVKSAAKIQTVSNKRASNSSEEELHIVKKKKKKPDESSVVKPSGFIPIEPLPAGSDEQDAVLDNKDVKLKIKSLPTKVSKKSDKATDKLIEKIKEKKKEKQNDTSASDNSISKNSTKKRNSSSTKTKEKASKSPPETKIKASKAEERKLEKITFRRESGDSWSSSRSNSPGLYTSVLSSSIGNKNNALGTLMAELSDQDDDDDDDDDDNDDIDLSTPFQSDSAVKQKADSVKVANNNILNKKDQSKPVKDKSKIKSKELPSKKSDTKNTHISSSKRDVTKSPVKTTKTEPVKTSFSKNSPKTKLKESKNGHQIPNIPVDLVHLQKQLMTIKDGNCLQKVADILEQSGCFIITETTLDFDLYKLDSATIKQIQQCIER